jgi:hypothetical protein
MIGAKQDLIAKIEQIILNWHTASAHAHAMGGREFRIEEKEIGHIHWNGDLDILFSKKIQEALLADQKVQTHKWIPNSGWTTFVIQTDADIEAAVELLRLSYLQKAKRQQNRDISEELTKLNFSEFVKKLL